VNDTAQRYTDYVYGLLDARIKNLNTRLSKIEERDKIAETAYSMPYAETLAAAPTGLTRPELCWIANGRKAGEGVGAGTGVPAVWNPPTSTWFSMFSGVAVTV
jgi:hypothetical protein